jgi:putative acetyltransferase
VTATPIAVRAAEVPDRDAILELVRQAFSEHTGGEEEVDIVRATWKLGVVPDGLELVAVEDGTVVGHVLAARGDLAGREVVGVAPLAVTPARQGVGVGTALMTELIGRADTSELPLLVLLGSPDYYERFGFEPSGPLGLTYPPAGPDSPYFQVRKLTSYDPSYRGDYTYCWEAPPSPVVGASDTRSEPLQ